MIPVDIEPLVDLYYPVVSGQHQSIDYPMEFVDPLVCHLLVLVYVLTFIVPGDPRGHLLAWEESRPGLKSLSVLPLGLKFLSNFLRRNRCKSLRVCFDVEVNYPPK